MIYQYIIYVGSLPEDVVPFDAASSVPIEEQKEAAMLTIQKCLNSQQAARALALLRAARYTYTLYTTLHPSVLWIRIRIGSVFRAFVDPYSEHGSGIYAKGVRLKIYSPFRDSTD